MTTQRRAEAFLAGAVATITVMLLAGCSDGSTVAEPLPEGTVEATASRAPDVEHAEALGAYRAMWDDLAVAAATSDAKHPQLKAHASGGALELLRYMMTQDRKKGVVTKGRLHLEPTVGRGGATQAVIRDCADSTEWMHYTEDGNLENGEPGGHHRVDATVRQRGGVWRVESLYIDQVGTC